LPPPSHRRPSPGTYVSHLPSPYRTFPSPTHMSLSPPSPPPPLPPPWPTIFTSSSLPTLARYLPLLSLSLLPLPSPPQPNTPSFVHSPSTLFVLRIISFVFVGALNAILTPSLPPLHAPLPHASVLVSFSTHPSFLLRRCGGSHLRSSIHRFGFSYSYIVITHILYVSNVH
jgi:hypothetical protein